MDANSKGKPPETEESAVNSAGNTSFILGPGNIVTPQKHGDLPSNPCTPDTFKSPLNFSTVTVEQLGITPESFVRNSAGKSSSSYLKKSRRRSAVGARGSPETNHLIRFIARQQNMKNSRKSPLAQDCPSPGSPALYRNVNSLRERISAFQSAFHSIKENEKMNSCPEFSEAGRVSEVTDLTVKAGLSTCQQSGFPAVLASKRRRISCQRDSDENLRDAEGKAIDLQILSIDTDRGCAVETSADLSEKSSKLGSTQSGFFVEDSLPLSELPEISNALKVADCVVGKGSNNAVSPDTFTAEVSSDAIPDVRAPATPVCRKDLPSHDTFILRSVLKKPSVPMCLESLQEHCNILYGDEDGTHPSVTPSLENCCKDREAEDEEKLEALAFLNMRKRKKVTFGEELSPEVFDESLPANTPLRKGGTPVSRKDVRGLSSLLLEQSPAPEPLPQPDFDDKGENLENIEPLQVSFAVLSSPNKSSISETLSGTDTFSSSNNHEKIASSKVSRITRTSNRRNLVSFVEESVCNLLNTEVQPCKEKKINRRKSQETKCTKRALPKKNQVLKSCRKKKGKGKKSVQKSIYGERDFASKKPLLSPIPELPEVSAMTPSVPSVRRLGSGYFNSNGKLEEVKAPKNLVKRKDLLPQDPDLHMCQGFDKYEASVSSSYGRSSSSLGNTASDEDPNTNMMNTDENKNIPKAKNKSESENEPKGGADGPVCCASVTEERVALQSPKPALILQQGQEFAAAGQNAETLCHIFQISPDLNIKGERQDDLLVAAEGKLQCNHLMPNSQIDCHCLGDVLIENKKESKSQSEDLGRIPMESSSVMSCRDRKHRRRSMCYSDGHSLPLEKNGSHTHSYSVGSSVEISLENSELCKDLSDTIEQTFPRRNSEIKVRRSMRLQKELEDEGLVWISLRLPTTSQKAKRRTISTFDSSGFDSMCPRKETVPSRQKPGMAPPISDQENSQGPAAGSSDEPGKRRKSFCVSTLANAKAASQSKGYRRRSSLSGKGESSLTALERIEHSGERKQ
ncbi:cell division cycle-associated protein 2 isoform X3 [Sapajus apella]|uniref:Cell division cycle-associated protein 2 isoform X3 n=1 Tax=Sapajus apella TaxID=9515 RepID=A0A6J3IPL0_SAPAP|nr:cell division cycle-associated protein 2 isoform X3 [Sapajus apella]